ncbi:hypothetical protein [Lewinella sp. 4G2]|uniref:hypothetical protein n=1 Tax=Lewinella sp. 4G2 TaxID=1803372 RepID=UPI0007B4DDF7|nr:hypothetical protein [Lewinella sp. 4G2]OAV43155.1 hypothetical protein A3850_000990 [Lewinella sp. 4G2]
MLHRYLLTCLLLFTAVLSAQPPTVPAASVSVRNITGQSMQLTIDRGDGERRIVVISDAPITGSPQDMIDYNPDLTFGDGDQIVPGEFVMFDGNLPNFDVFTGFVPATTYYVSVFEYNGQDQMTEYLTPGTTTTFTTLGQPTQQVSAVMVDEITGNSAQMTWTNGNGDGRIVVFREGAEVSANPIDLETYSNLSSSWRAGDEITPGNRVMFTTQGPRNSFVAQQLEPSKTYFYKVFEFNGTGNGKVYAVPGESGQFDTRDRPEVTGSLTETTNPQEGDRARFSYTQGDGGGRIFVVKPGTDLAGVTPTDGTRYTANTLYGAGDEIAPGAFVVIDFPSRSLNGTGLPQITIRNLQPGTTYTMGIYEYDYDEGFNGLINYQTVAPATITFTTAGAPTVQASDIVFSDNTGNSIQINYDRGNGDAALVVFKPGSPVDFVPTDLTSYTTSTSVVGSRGDLGNGNRAVWASANQPFLAIQDLTPGVRYYVSIFEYNGNSGRVYFTPGATSDFLAALTPSESATNMDFRAIEGDRFDVGWDVGNGQRRLLVAREGQPVTASPVDAGARLDDGNQVFGAGTDIGSGEFVVFDGTFNGGNTQPVIEGLEIATTYHFALFEYNEDGNGNTYYRRTDPATGSQSTATIPTVLVSDLNPQEENAVSITFVPENDGGGERSFLVMKEGSAVDVQPANLTRYTTNIRFGEEEIANGNYAMGYKSLPSTQFPVTELLANTTYHAAYFELNGRNFPVYSREATRYSFTTETYATEGATSLEAVNVGAEQLRLQFFRGNGARRITVARLATAAEVQPMDNQVYVANEVFGMGSDLGGGNFVVNEEDLFRPNNRHSFNILGLDPDTEYVLTTYEVTANRTDTYYRVPGESLTVMTSAEPTIAPINLQINDTLNESATIAWTTGNGDGEVVLIRQGSPVGAVVATGTRVRASSTYTAGGTSNWIGDAQPVFFGPQTQVSVTRLQTGTEYFVQVQAYNGYFESPAYQQDSVTTSFRTLGPPEIQASNLRVTSSTPNRISLAWTKGGGTDRLLVAKAGSAVDTEPVDNVRYTPNTFFGSGDDLGGGNYVIAAGDFDTISVTNLTPNEIYHFKVFEYNTQNTVLYNRDSPPMVSAQAEFFLPVTWSHFSGRSAKQSAILDWGTAAEEGSDYFAVERASSATPSFTEVGRVAALGEAGKYTFTDPELLPDTYLYRLRQVDTDGAFTYSRVINVTIGGTEGLSVYPNPTVDRVKILGAAAGAKYVLRSQGGRVLRTGNWSSDGLSVTQLEAGSYYLTVGEKIVKFIKR